MSSSMLRSHVVRGRPRGLFQSSNGWSKMTLLASIVSLILATCPNKERRLDWTMRESWGCCVLERTAPFRTKSFHRMPRILRRHHWSRAYGVYLLTYGVICCQSIMIHCGMSSAVRWSPKSTTYWRTIISRTRKWRTCPPSAFCEFHDFVSLRAA